MNYGQYPLTFINSLLLCCISGIIAAGKISLPVYPLTIALVLFFIFAVYLTAAKSKYTFLIIGLLFIVLGFYRGTAYNNIASDNIINLAGQQETITGTLQAEPSVRKDEKDILHIRYELSAQSAKGEKVSGGYYLYSRQKDYPQVQIGDKITASGKIRRITSYNNPGRIDTVSQAKQQGIYAFMTSDSAVKIEEQPDEMLLLKKVAKLRADIKASMEKVMPKADAAAVFAMLFGGYADIDPELLESFTATGIVHILSVSGSHITLLAGSIIAIGQLIRLKKWAVFFILTSIIIIYSIFSGFVPPVIRSAAMGILSYAALTFNRESQSRYLLAVVAVVMLIVSPGLIFNISFQLSFAATAGLLYAAPFFREMLHFLPKFLSLPLSITLGAQLFCLPFLSWYFHSLSLSSLIANIAAVPIIDAIIILALAAVIINIFLPFVSSVVFVLCSLMLGFTSEITKFLSLLPASTVYLPYMTLIGSILYYILLVIILNKTYRNYCYKQIKAYWLVFTVLSCLLITGTAYSMMKPQDLAVHFIDVGQGDAALIITPHKKSIMIDTGGTRDNAYDIGKRVDVPYLQHYGVTRLNYIFLSHSDADHAAGVSGIASKLPTDNIFIGRENRSDYAAVWHISPQSDIMNKVIPMSENQTFTIDGVTLNVIRLGASGKAGGVNETSAVIKLTYKNFSVLFTGDLPAQEESALVKRRGSDLTSTILKVAHHGSSTSSTKEFLQEVNPKWAVISVGANNSYGHPNQAVLDRLSDIDAAIYRTDQNGAVVFKTDGKKCTVEPYIE